MVGILHWITLIDGDAEVESSFHWDVELVEEVVELKDLMDHVCNKQSTESWKHASLR